KTWRRSRSEGDLSELGPQAQIARETKLVAVLEHASRDPAVLDEGPVFAAEVLQHPSLVAVRDLQMARLDLRRVDPDGAVSRAADDTGQIDDFDGHSAAVEAAAVEQQVEPLRQGARGRGLRRVLPLRRGRQRCQKFAQRAQLRFLLGDAERLRGLRAQLLQLGRLLLAHGLRGHRSAPFHALRVQPAHAFLRIRARHPPSDAQRPQHPAPRQTRSSRAAVFLTSEPGPLWKVLRAWMVMPRSRANSTACAFSTFAPASASSCISSCDSSDSRRALATIRGSALKTPSTSEQISQTSASRAAASATAVVSLPPRPRVVTSFSREPPW